MDTDGVVDALDEFTEGFKNVGASTVYRMGSYFW